MNTRRNWVTSFFVGVAAGAAITCFRIAPKFVAILTAPVAWLAEVVSIFPNESLGNLAVVLPLLALYWGFLGLLINLLISAIFKKTNRSTSDKR
ncbi:MAG: hypothetical protein ACXWBP_00490 [Limisphaerales bacterium]